MVIHLAHWLLVAIYCVLPVAAVAWAVGAQRRGGRRGVVDVRDITANVVAALEVDDDRRRALLEAWIPRPVRRPFERFAAVTGSSTHARFRSGENRYTSARLVKAGTARA